MGVCCISRCFGDVGGHNKLAMADLRKMLSGLGFSRVQTYIQSGNALFESDEEPSALVDRIEAGTESAFGFSSKVTLRTAEQIGALLGGRDGADRLVASGRQVYLLCHQSIRDSKAAALLEKLGMPMTSRNLVTLWILRALADARHNIVT